MKKITVLIPTYNRLASLAVMLLSLLSQSEKDFDIIISDQSDEPDFYNTPFMAVVRLLRLHRFTVRFARNLPRRGMAQQRQFLLNQSVTPYSLFIDDDMLLEPYVVTNLLSAIKREECGFVGAAPIGLSHLHDMRPDEERVEFWQEKVKPETVTPKSTQWQRYKLHNAANLYHVAMKKNITPDKPRIYKIAWIGGCVLYDTRKLKRSGGFNFGPDIPASHCGEDVAAQLRLLERYGGCGIMPSGVYHQEVPTTIEDRQFNLPEQIDLQASDAAMM